jgi:transcriptional regulator with XRE-family HTH domain
MQITPVSELLDRLFRSRLRPDGSEYTYTDVARSIKEQFGEEITYAYISKIRAGTVENPGHHTLLVLSAFFRVSAGYFFPELEELLTPNAVPRPEEMLREALLTMHLPSDIQQHLLGMVLALYQHQQRAQAL